MNPCAEVSDDGVAHQHGGEEGQRQEREAYEVPDDEEVAVRGPAVKGGRPLRPPEPRVEAEQGRHRVGDDALRVEQHLRSEDRAEARRGETAHTRSPSGVRLTTLK